MHSTSSVIQKFGTLRADGHTRDQALQVLRDGGANPMQCIVALAKIEQVGLGQAKKLLHESPAWADVLRENDEALIAELEAIGHESGPTPEA